MNFSLIGIYLRGLAMGAADVVPGVSGGTIAFVTGIYERLINSLGAFTPRNAKRLLKRDVRGFWSEADGNFLLTLFAGILTSIATLARAVTLLLDAAPHLVWSFFAGLVVASAIHLGARVTPWRWLGALAFAIGLSVAVLVVSMPSVAIPHNSLWIFASGAVAICAMVLPGISGSFILLLLGMYAPTLRAVSHFDVGYLALFASGCALGLLGFVQLLRWLLHRYHDNALLLLTGFLLGSLPLLWPWQDRGTNDGLLMLMPGDYQATTGLDPEVIACTALLFFGMAAVRLLDVKNSS